MLAKLSVPFILILILVPNIGVLSQYGYPYSGTAPPKYYLRVNPAVQGRILPSPPLYFLQNQQPHPPVPPPPPTRTTINPEEQTPGEDRFLKKAFILGYLKSFYLNPLFFGGGGHGGFRGGPYGGNGGYNYGGYGYGGSGGHPPPEEPKKEEPKKEEPTTTTTTTTTEKPKPEKYKYKEEEEEYEEEEEEDGYYECDHEDHKYYKYRK